MIVSMIAAMDEARGIGIDNRLPWRLSSDLKRFKTLTMGHHIIVGRKTFESIGKPLPGRHTIILTNRGDFSAPGCLVADSLEEALNLAKQSDESEVFVCGGARVFQQALPIADRFYLTVVHANVGADTFFPEWRKDEWVEEEVEDHAADEKNQYPLTFKVLVRRSSASS
jgi:dihydrofolate reductase